MAGCAIEEPHVRRGKTGDERGPSDAHSALAARVAGVRHRHAHACHGRRARGAAAAASYKVDIEATPRSLRKLLEAHLDVARFAKRPDISDDQFEFLITATPQQVRDLAATQGYFSPVVRTDVRTVDDQKRVTVSVDPGPQTLITSISLSFRGPVLTEDPAQENAARFAFSLHEGDPFSQGDWDDAKNASLKALQARRYLGAKIYHSEARIDPRTHEAKLSVTYDSGPTFTMGKLDVSGTRRYPEQIVDNVNPISAGDIYDVQRVAELQRQLQNTPYYASVAIDVDSDPAKPVDTPMHVKVSEYPYNSIRGGVGYSTDNGPLIQGSYSYLDTFGKAWPFTSTAASTRSSSTGKSSSRCRRGRARGPIACWLPTPRPTCPTRASTVSAAACSGPARRNSSTTTTRSFTTRTGSTRTRPRRPPAARWCRHGRGPAAIPTTRCSRARAT